MTWKQSQYFNIPFLEARNYDPDHRLVYLCGIDYCRDLLVLPIYTVGEILTVCTPSPTAELRDRMEARLNLKVLFVLGSVESVTAVLFRYSSAGLQG